MRYGQIRRYDVANGPGIRTTIFVTGCSHRCPACFNEQYQDFSAGELWTDRQTKEVIEDLLRPEVSGLTLLGGEPFQNTQGLIELLKEIRKQVDKSIWIYSGYTFEQLIAEEEKKELLSFCHVLVDGLFVQDLKDLRLSFRGSSNQRIIDVQRSLKEQRAILMKPYHQPSVREEKSL